MGQRALKLPGCYELAVSPCGRYVASLGRDIVVANLEKRERCLSSRSLAHPSSAAFNNSESQIAVKNTSGDLVVLDVGDGRPIARHKAKDYDEGAEIHFSACDQFLIDGSWNGAIRVRRADNLQTVEEFTYQDEMVKGVSRTADGTRWLFTHQPKTRDGENFPPPPYLTLWEWPLRSPARTIDPQFYSVGAASISPCGSFIATVGSHRALPDGSLRPDELRVSSISHDREWTADVTFAGTAYRARWSRDSRLLGSIDKSGLLVFQAEGLVRRHVVTSEFPSDIAFIDEGASAVIGTWSKAWIEAL